MSHPAEEAPPLVPLRFATLEELEEWLQCVVPQEPDLRLSTWRVMAASSVRVIDVLLRHAGQLPMLRELLIAPRRLESQEGGEPDAPHPARRQATATAESDTITDESLPRDDVGSRQPSTTDTAVSHSSAPQIELETELDTTLETGAVTTSVSMASVSSILTALDGAVAAVYCGAAPGIQPGGGEGTEPHCRDAARGGRSVDIWPMLEVVRGDLEDIVQLCERLKGCIYRLLVWLPSRSLEVAVDRERLKHVLLALDAVMLEVETQEDEWRGLLSVLGDVGEVVRCQRLDIFVYPVHPAESRHSMDRGSRGRNRLSRPTSAVVKSNQITAAFSEAQVLPHAKINVVDHVR